MDYVPLPRGRLWKSKADFFRPFRSAAAEAGENITPLYDPVLHRQIDDQPDLQELNACLYVLVDLFPDVEPEVFREMLLSLSQESRLQVVTEHLLTKKEKWARGRYRTTPEPNTGKLRKRRATKEAAVAETFIVSEQKFRSDDYKKAVKQVFYQEFKNLSHSSIKAVLAEQNFSYTLSRPILQQVSTKSWRFSLSHLWPKKGPAATASEHPFIFWQSGPFPDSQSVPAIRRTGSATLDEELYELFVVPVMTGRRQALLARDYAFAIQLNKEEAEVAEALFECECCYSSVTFEELSTCDDRCHQLCFDCVRRTVNEALFGQGWARNVELERSTVRCFAPTSEECNGVISPEIVRQALSTGCDNEELWNDFQMRAATDALSKSRVTLQRCPFCSYAEVDETPRRCTRELRAIWHHIAVRTSETTQLMTAISMILLSVFAVPLLILACATWLFSEVYPPATRALDVSWSRVYRERCSLKFHCRNPTCSATTCTRCRVRWHDPHTCFENERSSLRTAIESSATAAIKRTCPKCMLSFVKSSGCNKLVCNCGYTMCYICRQEITAKENYAHFCQHFRPTPGRCEDCDRCDLYEDEDEEVAIRRAAEEAEKAWKETEGLKDGGDERATREIVAALVDRARGLKTWERCLDAIVDAVVA